MTESIEQTEPLTMVVFYPPNMSFIEVANDALARYEFGKISWLAVNGKCRHIIVYLNPVTSNTKLK